jgi:hypothetical protein
MSYRKFSILQHMKALTSNASRPTGNLAQIIENQVRDASNGNGDYLGTPLICSTLSEGARQGPTRCA